MKIGNLNLAHNVFLAPMAGITNLPFRLLVREFGCALAFTEMISAHGILRKGTKTIKYLDMDSRDRPLGVQIFGADPMILAEAAAALTEIGADLIDINMGCPVRKVVKTGAGAALMRNPAQVERILEEVRRATFLPLTIKIRSGWSEKEITAREIARIAEGCGVDAIIVHPRTAEQQFTGNADWSILKKVKETVRIPIIGSGDVRSSSDALRMITSTGCDAVMIGRGALGTPWIFREILSRLRGEGDCEPPSFSERERILLHHMEMELHYGRNDAHAVRRFRKHILWYTKGLKGGNVFRKKVCEVNEREEVVELIREFFCSLGSESK